MSTDNRTRAWVELSAPALRANFRAIRKSVGDDVRVVPMVKANAYGLGVREVVEVLDPLEPWGYGVATVEEGLELRGFGVRKPVLVCSPLAPDSYRSAVGAGLTVSISDLQGLAALRKAGEMEGIAARFHLEVDTGMGRAGFDWHRVKDWAPEVRTTIGPELILEGFFTHFHSADGSDKGPTLAQWGRLTDTLDVFPQKPEGLIVHACNSPGALRLPEFARNAVRPGIFLYGGVAGEGIPAPEPVAALRARIVYLKEAVAGSTVGYGSTYAAAGEERWASVGIGYGDGLPRLLSNRGEALVHGRRAPIIGRVSMDVTVLDVSHVPSPKVGDVVTFFGRADGTEILLEEVAGHAETINYEVLTGLTRRLPRIWTDHGGY